VVDEALIYRNTRDLEGFMVGYMLHQMSARVGIKKYGDKAIEALFNDFLQLHRLDTFFPEYASSLSPEQRRKALRAISTLKEKRDGILKGRTYADGRQQRGYKSKAETASPTTHTDSVLLTAMVDAYEQRDVAVADVVGAYLNAFINELLYLKLTDE